MNASKPVVLRSAANPTVRHLVRMRDNRARRKAGRVIVDGWRETRQAIDAGMELLGLFVSESESELGLEENDKVRGCRRTADQHGKLHHVSDSVMNKIAYGQSPRGVVAEFAEPMRRLSDLRLPDDPLLVLMDRIEKPGNVGAVFRCADAVGVDAILMCDSGDLWNPNTIRSSQGCVFHVASAVGSQEEIAHFFQANQIRLVAARVESSQGLWESSLMGSVAILLGSEAHGLGSRWQQQAGTEIEGVRIPMAGSIDSLNVAVSAAVILYEAMRQRQSPS